MITVASRKQKGRKLQQWVRDKILDACTSLTTDDVRSTPMGVQGADVQLSTKAKDQFPFAVECKSMAKNAIYKHYEQATSNKENLEPLLIIKANNKKPLVIVDADYFLWLYRMYRSYGVYCSDSILEKFDKE